MWMPPGYVSEPPKWNGGKYVNLLKVVSVVRKILGAATDLLVKGRQAGLWTEKNTIKKGK
jgi:hypothetical protein